MFLLSLEFWFDSLECLAGFGWLEQEGVEGLKVLTLCVVNFVGHCGVFPPLLQAT